MKKSENFLEYISKECLDQQIREAIEELDHAEEAESLAISDYIELAIERTNVARMHLNYLYKLRRLYNTELEGVVVNE